MNRSMKERLKETYRESYFDPEQNLTEQTSDHQKVLKLIFDIEEYYESPDIDETESLEMKIRLGHLYRLIGKPEESIHYHKEYLRRVKTGTDSQVLAFIGLGESYVRASEYKKALLCYEKAEHIIHQENLDQCLEKLEYHRGRCHMEMREFELAISSFQEAFQHSDRKSNGPYLPSSEAIEICRGKLEKKNAV